MNCGCFHKPACFYWMGEKLSDIRRRVRVTSRVIRLIGSYSAHKVFVEDFMVRKIRYLTADCTYRDAQALLNRYGFRSFPLVESRGTSRYALPPHHHRDAQALLNRYGFRSFPLVES